MPKKPPADPQSCESCRFFKANQSDEYGYCRRLPPIPVAEETGTASIYPVIEASDWCGEWSRLTH